MSIFKSTIRTVIVDIQSFILAILMLVWSIPHTIALRNISGVLLLVSALPFFYYAIKKNGVQEPVKTFWQILFALSIWILFQAIFISPEPMWALREIRGQWDTTLLFALLAMSLASIHDNRDQLLRIALYVLIILTAYYVLEAIKQWHYTGVITTRRIGLHDSPVLQSYLNALLMAFLIGDLYVSFFKGKKTFLNLPLSIQLGLITMVVFSTYLTRIRLGVIGIVALLFSGAVLLVMRKNVKALLTGIFIFSSAITLFTLHYMDDARWHRLFDTVVVAIDINNNTEWADSTANPPTLPDGTKANSSNYDRIAWATAGIKMSVNNPLGVGYGRNSFGHQGAREYGLSNKGQHSHSGLIDWTLAVGFPGLILWLAFNGYILFYSAQSGFGPRKNPLGVALFLITMSALYRSLVDSTLRDHLLQMNMFFMAYLIFTISDLKASPSQSHPILYEGGSTSNENMDKT